nr:uncharacterized protein LOC111415670 [Onthophagus taurus]
MAKLIFLLISFLVISKTFSLPLNENLVQDEEKNLTNASENIKIKLIGILNILKQFQSDNIKEVQPKSHQISKRQVTDGGINDIFGGVIASFYSTINAALRTIINTFLTNINESTGGFLTEILINLRDSVFNVIDSMFPVSSTIGSVTPIEGIPI